MWRRRATLQGTTFARCVIRVVLLDQGRCKNSIAPIVSHGASQCHEREVHAGNTQKASQGPGPANHWRPGPAALAAVPSSPLEGITPSVLGDMPHHVVHFGSPRRSSLLIDLAVLSASEPSQSSSSSDEEDGCEGSGAESTARSLTGDGLLGVQSGVEDARSGLQPVLRANAAAYSQ